MDLEGEFFADCFEFFFGKAEMTAMVPGVVKRHEVDMGVRDVGANYFPDDTFI